MPINSCQPGVHPRRTEVERHLSCAKTVPECDLFELLGLALSEKQVPQVIERTEKAKWPMEPLESVGTRPRQARYQAALRPDVKCILIIRHLPTRTLLQPAKLALME